MSDETTEAAAPAGRRARFAGWRRQRPFWGAVLTIVSGVVLWFSGRLQLDSFEIQLGIEGMQSTLLPVALIALGVLVLFQPQYRVFYGVITLAISVYSLLGVNLGGFGVGMVLGVVGGILVVSWLPRARDGRDTDADVGPDTAGGAIAEAPPADQEPTTGRRHAVAVAAAAVLAVGGASGSGAVVAAPVGAVPAGVPAASGCWDPLGWLEWICGDDEGTATPSPSPSTDATDGPDDDGSDPDAVDGDAAVDGGGTGDSGDTGAGVLDPGGDAVPGPDGPAGDEERPGSGDDDPGDTAADGSDGSGDPGETADDDAGEPSPEEARQDVEEAARLELGPCARITFGGEYDITVSLPGDCGVREDENVFSLDADLEARDLQLPLTGINGIDVVNVPVTTDGPRRDALRISVDEVKVPGFWLKTYAHDGGTVTNADYVSMTGDAQMYISSIHADLPDGQDLAELGEKLVGGASLVEMLLGLTDARIGLMGATSDVQVWSDFREQVWSD
ncbi:DUF6114 domain-containing protein [Isoptericola sp. BMS4]|uniref:DUF6114 domain-containing protein n=1 Tax=Isoptericola sp. BMS4 TaxID=2527875 RepID=UPI0014239800|nr:DUF6114 domain-containing protein [Isoptericola sp. BMS4]